MGLFKQGVECLHAGRAEEALVRFARIHKNGEYLPGLYYGAAVAYMQLGRVDDAITVCQMEIARDADHAGAKALLKRIMQDATPLQQQTALQNTQLLWPENTYLVNHDHKFIYCPIEKVVCSNIKRAILKVSGIDKLHTHREYDYTCNVHSNIYDCALKECTFKTGTIEAFRLLKGNTYFKFAFVRNPWSRLVSAYIDKVAAQAWELIESREKFIRRIQRVNGLPQCLDKRITFRQFAVDAVECEDMQLDFHWRPQVCFFGAYRFDFIGKFENFQADVESINRKLGINLDLGQNNNTVGYARDIVLGAGDPYFDNCYADKLRKIKEDSGGFPDYKRFYPPDLRELVAKRYQKDIEAFGYDFE